MRHIGTLPTRDQAARFAAYLVTQGMPAHAEEESDGWAIWVRDEDHLERAKEEMDRFRADPHAARYAGVEQQATQLLREEQKRRQQAQKHLIPVGEQWRGARGGRRPLTIVLIVLSIVVTLWTGFGKDEARFGYFSFRSLQDVKVVPGQRHAVDPLRDVRAGQLWRLVTPAFMHGSLIHLLFNMYWLYLLGELIEVRRGTWRLALMVLCIAAVSNAAQALLVDPWFLGMSGVVYGLFGYCWMKTLFDPRAGIYISQGTVLIMVIWFLLCAFGVIPNVANVAHGAGFIAGAVIGLVPVVLRGGPLR